MLAHRLYSQLQPMNWADGRMGESEGVSRGRVEASNDPAGRIALDILMKPLRR